MLKRSYSFLLFCISWAMILFCACAPYNQLSKLPFRTLTGLVVENDGKPLKGVTVTSDPPTSALLTDALGKFLITGLPEGTYTIHLVKQGYISNSILIAIKGLGPVHVDAKLEKKIITSPLEQEKLMPKIHHKY